MCWDEWPRPYRHDEEGHVRGNGFQLWETVLWIGVFAEIRKRPLLFRRNLKVVDEYLDKTGCGRKNIDDVLLNRCRADGRSHQKEFPGGWY